LVEIQPTVKNAVKFCRAKCFFAISGHSVHKTAVTFPHKTTSIQIIAIEARHGLTKKQKILQQKN